MVSISVETPSQTDARLRKVIAASDLVWERGEFSYAEYPAENFPAHEAGVALAFVRDQAKWSVLKPGDAGSGDGLALFSFHFPEGLDNSGFVGWLASIIKAELGSGVIVVCGQNTDRGGIFDYWGVPASLRADAARLLDRLRRSGA